jgi:WD40 repeat protein
MRRAIRRGGNKTRLLHLRCQKTIHEWDSPVSWAPFESDGRALFFASATVTPTWKIGPDKVQGGEAHPVKLANLSQGHMSDNEKRIVAIQSGTVSVYDCQSGSSVWSWTPPAHFYGVREAALSGDGGHLLTANGDGTVYVIQLP